MNFIFFGDVHDKWTCEEDFSGVTTSWQVKLVGAGGAVGGCWWKKQEIYFINEINCLVEIQEIQTVF